MVSATINRELRRMWTDVPVIGGRVFVREWPGPIEAAGRLPLILVAGLGASSGYWVRLGRRLCEQFHILAPDLPGFGRSPRPGNLPWPGGPSPAIQADQLLAWMNARGIEKANLCGHSTGCQTVVDFAARFPERVNKIILAAPTFEAGRRALLAYLPRLLAGAIVESPSLIALLPAEYVLANPLRVLEQALRTIGDPVESKLPRVAAETLVIHGRLDPLVRHRWAETVTALLPRGRLVTIDRVGHAVHYSAAAVTAKVIGDFLLERIDLDRPDTEIAAADDPHHDLIGPPQPITPCGHLAIDCAVAVAALAISRRPDCGVAARRTLLAQSAVTTGAALATTPPLRASLRLPMLPHANADILGGLAGLIAACCLRKQPMQSRLAIAGLAALQIISASFTAKATGPARLHSTRNDITPT